MTPTHDVLIAGAGPVGLFLACELHLAGLSVLVLESDEDPGSPLSGCCAACAACRCPRPMPSTAAAC